MLFSHSAAYAVRALTWLACQPKDSRWLATDVASREGIPRPYLSKVLGVLKTQGLVSSVRGPKGGYVLVQDPDTISLMHVLTLFDSEKWVTECPLAFGNCGECTLCPLGDVWDGTRTTLQHFMEATTIGSLAQRTLSKTAEAVRQKRTV